MFSKKRLPSLTRALWVLKWFCPVSGDKNCVLIYPGQTSIFTFLNILLRSAAPKYGEQTVKL